MTRFFPVMIIGLSLGASVVYFYAGDVKRGVYWLAAAAIGVSVTC